MVGVFKPHHRFLLTELLAQIDALDEAITRVSNEIAAYMQAPGPAELILLEESQTSCGAVGVYFASLTPHIDSGCRLTLHYSRSWSPIG